MRDCVDTLVGPVRALIYVRGSLHVAIGEMDFDSEVVFSSAQVVVTSGNAEIEHPHRASAANGFQ